MRILLSSLRFSSLVLSLALVGQSIAQAQVSISPMVIEAQENRGQTQGLIEVRNDSNETFRARIYTESFTYDRDKGFQSLPSSPNDLSPYLQFSPREMVLQANADRRVRFITRLDPSLPDGEYRTMIFTENLKETPLENGGSGPQVSLAARIGVAVFVRKGNISPNLSVSGASVNMQQQRIQLLVRNTGKASARPQGTWSLKKGSTVVKTGEIPATIVLAENERNCLLTFLEKDQNALPPGDYQVTGELAWGEGTLKNVLPFNVNLKIPSQSAVLPSP